MREVLFVAAVTLLAGVCVFIAWIDAWLLWWWLS